VGIQGVEIQHHLFLTYALDGGSELDASAALLPTPTPHWERTPISIE